MQLQQKLWGTNLEAIRIGMWIKLMKNVFTIARGKFHILLNTKLSLKVLESLAQDVGHLPGGWRDVLGSCSHVCLDGASMSEKRR